MDKIKNQSSKVGELIFSAETGSTYRRALVLTWNILRETGILLWLVVCLLFVRAEGFWKTSIQLGRRVRSWYEGLRAQDSEDTPKSAEAMSQSVLSALSTGAATLLYHAKKQLGLDAEPPASQPPQSQVGAASPSSSAPGSDAAIAAAAKNISNSNHNHDVSTKPDSQIDQAAGEPESE